MPGRTTILCDLALSARAGLRLYLYLLPWSLRCEHEHEAAVGAPHEHSPHPVLERVQSFSSVVGDDDASRSAARWTAGGPRRAERGQGSPWYRPLQDPLDARGSRSKAIHRAEQSERRLRLPVARGAAFPCRRSCPFAGLRPYDDRHLIARGTAPVGRAGRVGGRALRAQGRAFAQGGSREAQQVAPGNDDEENFATTRHAEAI
jgi:hypothetical protein